MHLKIELHICINEYKRRLLIRNFLLDTMKINIVFPKYIVNKKN